MKSMLLFISIIPALFTLAFSTVNKCGSGYLDGCFCGSVVRGEKAMFVVNCTNQGFNNTKVLEDLPEEIEELIFTGNHIDILPSNVFGEDADLSDLKIIDMSNNGIKEIKGKAFHHVLGVTRLILNHNNISISEEDNKNYHHPRVFSNFLNLEELHLTNAFADNTAALANDLHDIFVNSNLTKLYKLHLEQNEIKNFKDDRVFCDLPNLHDLYLGDNDIPNLNFNITCLPKLRYLDLEDNKITKFSQRDLDSFDRLAPPYRNQNFTLDIGGNPIRCDSVLKGLFTWLQTTKVEELPSENEGSYHKKLTPLKRVLLESLDVTIHHFDKLQCSQFKMDQRYVMNLKAVGESKHTRISKSLTILLVILVLILITLLVAYVYLKKETVRMKLSPLFEAVSRKVQYTTIESQDV